jgi:hypothetical protein
MDIRPKLDQDAWKGVGVPPQIHRQPSREDGGEVEAKVAAAYERCHPGDSFADLKKRARFSKEDRGLLADWMAAFANEESRP